MKLGCFEVERAEVNVKRRYRSSIFYERRGLSDLAESGGCVDKRTKIDSWHGIVVS